MPIQSEQFVYTVTGVLLGGLITLIGFLYKQNLERIRTINEAVFNLLELRHIFRALEGFDEHKATQQYLKIVRRRFPEEAIKLENESEIRAFLSKLFREEFKMLYELVVRSDAARFSEWYFEAIRRLASVEPVLAYELSGNRNIQALLEAMDRLSCLMAEPDGGEPSEDSHEAVRAASSQLAILAVRDLVADIRKLAWRSGLRNYFRVLWKTRRKAGSDSELEEQMERFVNEYFDRVMMAVQQRHAD